MPFLAAPRRALGRPRAQLGISQLLFIGAAFGVVSRFALPAAVHWTLFAITALWCLHLARPIRPSAGEPTSGGRPARKIRFPQAAALTLPLAILAALAGRLWIERAPAPGPGAAERAAERARVWLSETTREMADAALLLTGAPRIAPAVEGSDLPGLDRDAWREIADWPLPEGAAGPGRATLYDQRLSPVVWSGGGPDLGPALDLLFPGGVTEDECPDPTLPRFSTHDEGARRWLFAARCLGNYLGLVTVEFPVVESPPPASGGRRVSAIESAAGRGVEIQLLRAGEDGKALTQLFERRGESFLAGAPEAEQYFFALRTFDGQLLGAANTVVAPTAAKLRERRAEAAFFGALALLVGAIVSSVAKITPARAPRRRESAAASGPRAGRGAPGPSGFPATPAPAPLLSLSAIWTVRVALALFLDTGATRLAALPGVGRLLEPLLAPGTGAPPLLGLPDTPLDSLATAVAIFLSARVATTWLPTSRTLQRFRGRARSALRGAAAATLAILAAVPGLGVARAGGLPLAPIWEVDTGIGEILAWTALLLTASACVMVAARLLRPEWPTAGGAAAVLALCASFFSPMAAAAALLPLAAAGFTSAAKRGRIALRELRRPLLTRQPEYAFVLAFVVFAAPPLLLYPAFHFAEEDARRRYAEEAVPRLAARHALSVCYAASEAARRLDEELLQLDSVRPDTAYRLWLATGLIRSPAASALEVRGPEGVVSRFRVGLDRRPDPPVSSPAPPAWSGLDDCAREPYAAGPPLRSTGGDRETAVTARRRYPSGFSLTLTAALRPQEMAFLSRPTDTAAHFRLAGDAAPGVFSGGPDGGLRLEPTGAPDAPDRHSVAGTAAFGPYRVSWPRLGAADHAARAAGWLFLASLLAGAIALAAYIPLWFPGAVRRKRRRSLLLQLTGAVAGAVLIAIFGLTLFLERRLSSLLDDARAEEARARAEAAARVGSELGAFDLEIAGEELSYRLGHAADQVAADAALYVGGRLVAASRPELALGGLLPARPPPETAFSRAGPLLQVEDAGAFRYRIAWTPVSPAAGPAPVFLAVPLPADEEAGVAGVRAMQRALLVGSGSVALVFAFLLPGFFARRIAAPVRRLAHATRQIAEGREVGVPLRGVVVEVRILGVSVERLASRLREVQQLELERTREEATEEATVRLARRAAHDIKNALTPISFCANYLRQAFRDPKGLPDAASAVEESVEDLLGQVDLLKQISSKFAAVGAPLQRVPLDLAELIRAVVRPWQRTEEPPVNCRAETPAFVCADPEIVHRIVGNLLQNAVDATADLPGEDREDDTTIEVRVRSDSNWVLLEVEDHGPGVPEELREQIFETDFSTRTRGTGLGLSSARRFAKAHGGWITAGPREDDSRGLRVTVGFPHRRPTDEESAG